MSHGLLIDTSIRGLQMALVRDAGVSSEIMWRAIVTDNPGSSGNIGALLRHGLRQVGIAADAVKTVMVASGPGSFTGIKIGLAFAYGFCRGLGESTTRCLGVSALDLVAKQLAHHQERTVFVALPATQTHGFLTIADGHQATTRTINLTETPLSWGLTAEALVEVIQDWPALLSKLDAAGMAGRLVPADQWRSLLIEGMLAEYVIALDSVGAQNEKVLPLPNFMRHAAPVEKQLSMGGLN